MFSKMGDEAVDLIRRRENPAEKEDRGDIQE